MSVKGFNYLSAFAYSISTIFFTSRYFIYYLRFPIVDFSLYSKTSPQLIQYLITFSHLLKASYSNLKNVFSEATFCSVLGTPLPPKSLGQTLHVSLCKICLNTCPFPESMLPVFSLPYIMCLFTTSLHGVLVNIMLICSS